MHDFSVEMVKEGHKKYINAMGCIKGVKYEARATAKTVILSVRHMEGERKVNEVINVGDLNDAAEMNDAYSLDLFEI